MTKIEFSRWAALRKEADRSLREACRAMERMSAISGPGSLRGVVDDAWISTGRAIKELANALDIAAASAKVIP